MVEAGPLHLGAVARGGHVVDADQQPAGGHQGLHGGQHLGGQPVGAVADGPDGEAERNRTEAKVRWRFTTEKARIKLGKLYPVLEYPEQPRP